MSSLTSRLVSIAIIVLAISPVMIFIVGMNWTFALIVMFIATLYTAWIAPIHCANKIALNRTEAYCFKWAPGFLTGPVGRWLQSNVHVGLSLIYAHFVFRLWFNTKLEIWLTSSAKLVSLDAFLYVEVPVTKMLALWAVTTSLSWCAAAGTLAIGLAVSVLTRNPRVLLSRLSNQTRRKIAVCLLLSALIVFFVVSCLIVCLPDIVPAPTAPVVALLAGALSVISVGYITWLDNFRNIHGSSSE